MVSARALKKQVEKVLQQEFLLSFSHRSNRCFRCFSDEISQSCLFCFNRVTMCDS